MAKRFTETGKWTDKWYRALAPLHKLAWGYLTDNCDPAGIIDLDRELADFQIGEKVDWDSFMEAAGDRVRVISRGKLWLAGFIDFQYGTLSPDCNAHKPVLKAVEKYKLQLGVSDGSVNPSRRVQDKDKDKDLDRENKKDAAENKSQATLPESIHTEAMAAAVSDWLAYKREKNDSYKPIGLKNFYTHLAIAVAEQGEAKIIAQMRKAMASNWKGWDHKDTARGSPHDASDPRGNLALRQRLLQGSSDGK